MCTFKINYYAAVVELVDTHALGACIARCEGSSPFRGTINFEERREVQVLSSAPDKIPEFRVFYKLVISICSKIFVNKCDDDCYCCAKYSACNLIDHFN
jgi:hypothetical protein